MGEEVLLRTRPRVAKGNPFGFVFLLLFVPLMGIGLLFLFFWFLSARNSKIEVTNRRVRTKEGILSNRTSELGLHEVKNIKIRQGPFQNFTGCGTLLISSAGQGGVEIRMKNLEDPQRIRDFIYEQRDQIRKESTARL